MLCLFKALFVLKALHFVACDFLDLLGLRKAGVVKKSTIFKTAIDRDKWQRACRDTAISGAAPVTANYLCVWLEVRLKYN